MGSSGGVLTWNGFVWQPRNTGLFFGATDIEWHDDGAGARLFAASGAVYSWDGSSWGVVGTGFEFGNATTLAAYDDGNGLALYAGSQTEAGTLVAECLWKWDGLSWTAVDQFILGGGGGPRVLSLCVFDDGRGDALYVGGAFGGVRTAAGDIPAYFVARWDGQTWEDLDIGTWGGVRALAVFDEDGAGAGRAALFVGSEFHFEGDSRYHLVVRWDGQQWSSVGATLAGPSGYMNVLRVFDDGTGPALYAGGLFDNLGGVGANDLARWDGESWSRLHERGLDADEFGVAEVNALEGFDDGHGAQLYIGGRFDAIGDTAAMNIARWDPRAPGQFFALGGGHGLTDEAYRLVTLDAGDGPAVYAAGWFLGAGSRLANGMARWDGYSWEPLGNDDGTHQALDYAVFDTGSGPRLYASGGMPGAWVAEWDGANWVDLPGHIATGGGDFESGVYELLATYGPDGPVLYAGGNFASVAGLPGTADIAAWDGQAWFSVGGGIITSNSETSIVVDMMEFDDGGGPGLFVTGRFAQSGGVVTNGIAKWDGAAWTPLGIGFPMTPNYQYGIRLCAYDTGAGPKLHVSGRFDRVGGVLANNSARWDGSMWWPLGAGLMGGGSGSPPYVSGLKVFDDGSGAALYAGGWFTTAGGLPGRGLARWDGAAWSEVAGGVSGTVASLAVFEDDRGPALYVGGSFTAVGPQDAAIPSANIARYGCLDTQIPGDLDCDGRVSFLDIDPFLLALFDAATYAADFPDCRIENGDLNADAAINLFDIDPFIACLFGACP